MKDLNYHFCNSASTRDDLAKFQEYFGTSIHIIFKYASTRWLYRQEVVERIIEQWEPLNYYFTLTDFVAESKNERLKFLSLGLKNHLYKLTFLFLEYILKIINDANLELQSEDARMHIY